MVRTVYKVLAADVVLLAALAGVLQDLAWRVSYATSPHPLPEGSAASYSFSILTRFFSISGGPLVLTSPPTLDWVQLLGLALVLVNGWFAYKVLVGGRPRAAPAPPTAPPPA